MERQLRDIFGDDQFAAERRDGRRLTLAIAHDVIAYHDALKAAGIPEPLRNTLVEHFSTHWPGPVSSDAEIVFSVMGEDDD